MREFCPDSSYFRLQWGTLWEGTVDWSSKELQHPEQASHQWILSHCDHVWSDPAADRGLGRYHGGHHHNLRSLSSGWEEPVADHLYVVQPGLERLSGFSPFIKSLRNIEDSCSSLAPGSFFLDIVKLKIFQFGWNMSDYGGVDSVVIHPRNLWIPDILLYNRSDLLRYWFFFILRLLGCVGGSLV